MAKDELMKHPGDTRALDADLDWWADKKTAIRKGTASVLAVAAVAALTACTPQVEATPPETDGTSQTSESPSATPSETDTNAEALTIVNLEINDFYAIGDKLQTETLYGLYFEGLPTRSIEDTGTALALASPTKINGKTPEELLFGANNLGLDAPAQAVAEQAAAVRAAMRGARIIENTQEQYGYKNVPQDFAEKISTLAFMVDKNGKEGPECSLRRHTLEAMDKEGADTLPMADTTIIAETVSDTFDENGNRVLVVKELHDGEPYMVTYIGTEYSVGDTKFTVYRILKFIPLAKSGE